jgi:cell division septum initiation protein DivIVA
MVDIEQRIQELQDQIDGYQAQLDAINRAIVDANDEQLTTLLHTQEKIHDNKKIASLQIDIKQKEIELNRLYKKYDLV